MICVVLAEFTKTVNLRHFFVPREGLPHTMGQKMMLINYNDNLVRSFFRLI